MPRRHAARQAVIERAIATVIDRGELGEDGAMLAHMSAVEYLAHQRRPRGRLRESDYTAAIEQVNALSTDNREQWLRYARGGMVYQALWAWDPANLDRARGLAADA